MHLNPLSSLKTFSILPSFTNNLHSLSPQTSSAYLSSSEASIIHRTGSTAVSQSTFITSKQDSLNTPSVFKDTEPFSLQTDPDSDFSFKNNDYEHAQEQSNEQAQKLRSHEEQQKSQQIQPTQRQTQLSSTSPSNAYISVQRRFHNVFRDTKRHTNFQAFVAMWLLTTNYPSLFWKTGIHHLYIWNKYTRILNMKMFDIRNLNKVKIDIPTYPFTSSPPIFTQPQHLSTGSLCVVSNNSQRQESPTNSHPTLFTNLSTSSLLINGRVCDQLPAYFDTSQLIAKTKTSYHSNEVIKDLSDGSLSRISFTETA